MRKAWEYISKLGLQEDDKSLESRCIVMANRLNFVMIVISVVMTIFLTVMRYIENTKIGFGSIRVLIVLIFCLYNIWLAKKGYFRLFKVILIFVPTFVILILSAAIGFIEEESFVYYPYIIIALSVIPQLIIIQKNEKVLFVVSVLYYFLLLIFIDNLLNAFSDKTFKAAILIDEFYIYYKIMAIAAFVFIFYSIYYLRSINIKFEEEIVEYNEELNSAIEELKVTQQHLVQSEKMASIGTLVSGVAHELNNPLNFIAGGIDAIESLNDKIDIADKSEFEEAMRITKEGLSRATNIVKSLMTFSHRGHPVLVKSDINQIIENTLLFIKTKIPQEINIQKDYGLNSLVSIFPGKIHQVFIGILDNALDAVQEPGVIEKNIYISTKQVDNCAQIIIANTGKNIPLENMDKIFDPFFTTKAPGKGPGLGLSISYSLIEEHNGTIYTQNGDNRVSFIIELPLGT